MKNFEELGVSSEIQKAIYEMGYENPMPVQEAVIPYLLGENNDVVALAQTGTGKTAAFGLPILQQVDVQDRVPQSLILCPTRELCLQISSDLTNYSKYIDGLKIVPVYGGSSIDSQIRTLKRGVHVIVATPGRLIDLMERKTVSLATVKNVVMDEADEMLNMGFTESINRILADIPKDRNTLLFSATMSPEISRISKKYLNNAKEITIGRKNESTNNVKHIVYKVHAKDKYAALKRIVDFNPQIYGIVFCRTRRETQEIADKLVQDGYSADSLHGELSQQQRDVVMQKFRLKNIQLLIATDVAARGLDVDDLTHVINYGLPDDSESYTHRSGRTGRAGKTGISIAIINLREQGKMREIERIIGKKMITENLPTAHAICEQQLIKVIDEIEKVKVNDDEIKDFLPEVYRKLDWISKEDLIKRMVSLEFNSFLDYYRGKEDIETATGRDRDSGRGERGDRNDRNRERSERRSKSSSAPRGAEAGYNRLFINLGKTDELYPAELIELLNKNIQKRVDVGRIDLMKNFSFFEVKEEDTSDVLKGLNSADFKGRNISVEIAGDKEQVNKRNERSDRNKGKYAGDRPYGRGKDRGDRSDRRSNENRDEGWARRKRKR